MDATDQAIIRQCMDVLERHAAAVSTLYSALGSLVAPPLAVTGPSSESAQALPPAPANQVCDSGPDVARGADVAVAPAPAAPAPDEATPAAEPTVRARKGPPVNLDRERQIVALLSCGPKLASEIGCAIGESVERTWCFLNRMVKAGTLEHRCDKRYALPTREAVVLPPPRVTPLSATVSRVIDTAPELDEARAWRPDKSHPISRAMGNSSLARNA